MAVFTVYIIARVPVTIQAADKDHARYLVEEWTGKGSVWLVLSK